jgi:hypothetical protein
MRPALAAGLAGAVLSGLPSTVATLIEGGDLLEGARAAGRMVLPRERRTPVLLAAAAPVHLALSLGWAEVLAAVIPPRAEPLYGAAGGLAIAALDLGVLGRFFPPVRALPQGRQWADHVAFGITVGAVLRSTRRGDRPPPGGDPSPTRNRACPA